MTTSNHTRISTTLTHVIGQDPKAAAELAALVVGLYDGFPMRCPFLPAVMPRPVPLRLNKFPLAAG